MKSLLLMSVLSLVSNAFATSDWKVIAESKDCGEKVQIMGKEGEKYVMAVKGDTKTKLFSKDGSGFNKENPKSTEYSAVSTDPSSAGTAVSYTQPGYTEGNLPKVQILDNGKSKKCSMNYKL
jgi:hypothetical protein